MALTPGQPAAANTLTSALIRNTGAGEWARTTDLLITNKLLRRTIVGDHQKQAHIRIFADADRLYQGSYILVGVHACPMRIRA